MEAISEPTLKYDSETGVVRARFGDPEPCVAVPHNDFTLLVSEGLDRVVGVDFENLETFLSRYVDDRLIPGGKSGDDLFREAHRHLLPMVALITRNFAQGAKDAVAEHDDLVARIARERGL